MPKKIDTSKLPLETVVRLKRPGMALEADHKNSRKSAIYLFCITCMGGSSQDVKSCKDFDCPLYQYRCAGATKGKVPQKELYYELLKGNYTIID